MRIKLKYVVEDVDRHGNVRLYYRRKGQPKVRLRGPIGSPEFLAAYRAAQTGVQQAIENPGLPRIKPKAYVGYASNITARPNSNASHHEHGLSGGAFWSVFVIGLIRKAGKMATNPTHSLSQGMSADGEMRNRRHLQKRTTS